MQALRRGEGVCPVTTFKFKVSIETRAIVLHGESEVIGQPSASKAEALLRDALADPPPSEGGILRIVVQEESR
jgi:hypothetical protein